MCDLEERKQEMGTLPEDEVVEEGPEGLALPLRARHSLPQQKLNACVVVCGRDGVWPWWCVVVVVCGHGGVWPWWCVAVVVCGRGGVWPWWCVAVMVCGRDGVVSIIKT